MEFTELPTLNAALNLTATAFLVAGYYWIRRGDQRYHRMSMLGAAVASAAFLTSYLIYHWQVGSIPFTREGWVRPVYFSILISHIVLAVAIVPLVVLTLVRAFRGTFERHRRIARWTWPLWMYVSVSGVVIYWMLYRSG